MANLTTKYMGLELKNPIIVGACDLSSNHDNLKKMEDAGAAAIVYKSIFEEQIELEDLKLQQDLTQYNDLHAEMLTFFPNLDSAGPEEYLLQLEKAKKAVSIPLFASINAATKGTWIEYARKVEKTGVDGLELNLFEVPSRFDRNSADVEAEQLEIIKDVVKELKIPVAVKLSSMYSSTLNFVSRINETGAKAVVLFNHFYQPDIDIEKEEIQKNYYGGSLADFRLPLRFAGLLYGNVNMDICATSGINTGKDIVKLLLAGANSVQIAGTLYKNSIYHIQTLLKELDEWMERKSYKDIDAFRGKLSKKKVKDIYAYKRAQYINILFNSR